MADGLDWDDVFRIVALGILRAETESEEKIEHTKGIMKALGATF